MAPAAVARGMTCTSSLLADDEEGREQTRESQVTIQVTKLSEMGLRRAKSGELNG